MFLYFSSQEINLAGKMSRNKIIPYRRDLKHKARELRKNSTLSEVLLWCEIKNRQIGGFQFHRQVPMLDYIVDFYCHELQLVIEVDGDSHFHENQYEYDLTRQRSIEEYGVVFLRFDDKDIKQRMGWVLAELIHCVTLLRPER